MAASVSPKRVAGKRKRRPNHRLVKIHRTYKIAEAAKVLGIGRAAVRRWIKSGLQTIDGGRPSLIHGRDLRCFLETRFQTRKQPCRLWELYCLKCRAPKVPYGNLVEYQAVTDTLGNLFGYCPDCQRGVNRRVNPAQLSLISEHLEVLSGPAETRISDSTQPSLDSYLTNGA